MLPRALPAPPLLPPSLLPPPLLWYLVRQVKARLFCGHFLVAASLYSIVIASLYNPAFVLYLAIVSVRARESVSKAYLLFSSQLPRGCCKRSEAAAGGRQLEAGYMNDVCSSLCIIHTMPKALLLTQSLENRTWKDPEESHGTYTVHIYVV